MPEVLAAIAVVALATWFGALVPARNPANHSVVEETARLRQHIVWLEQRLDLAEREKWGVEMVVTLEEELEATVRQLGNRAGY
ncbi:MAG: hypothetical protein ACREH8_17990 [Opitutaceae bacterium]